MTSPASPPAPPHWSVVLRALREARSLTQDGWAAHLGAGRRTVQRWEQGLAVPDATARRAILEYCQERGLYRRFEAGPLAGLTVTVEWLGDLLAAAQTDGSSPAGRDGSTTLPATREHQPTGTRPAAFPVPLTSLIGREQEIAAVVDLLGKARLVTLTGPGGTGKTRLAVAVAEQMLAAFADGAGFVDLSVIRDPGLIASTIAQALGLREAEGQTVVDSLRVFLRDRRVLIVLDNVEQVAAGALLLADLLAAAPRLTLLVTSRVLLHLRGEREFAVPPLPMPDPERVHAPEALAGYPAVALFIERASETRPDFTLTRENAGATALLCARLDGLPLAIELAAARVRLLSPQAMLPRLEHRLTLLTAGARDLPQRQQTLRDTIAWSYDLLSQPEQRLFRRLAVFAGGCTLDTAVAVCDGDGDLGVELLDGMAALVDGSLLRQEDEPDGEPRFRMLETIREFALEALHASGESAAVEQRHAALFLALAGEAAPHLRSGTRESWLRRLDAELDNLRAALTWSRAETDGGELALKLAAALLYSWRFRSRFSEGRRWLELALTLPAAQSPSRERALALCAAGFLAWCQGDGASSRVRQEEGIALLREVGRPRDLVDPLMWRAFNPGISVTPAEHPALRALVEESVALAREAGDSWGLAYALTLVGGMAWFAGDYAATRPSAEESLLLFRQLDDAWGSALALGSLALADIRDGDFLAAQRRWQEALAVYRAAGDVFMTASTLNNLAVTASRLNDWDRAETLYAECLALRRDNGGVWGLELLLNNLGVAALHRGDAQRAAPLFAEALTMNRERNDPFRSGINLEGLAGVAGHSGQPERAARLFGAAEAIVEASGGVRQPGSTSERDRWRDAVRSTLGEQAFAAAFAEGRALSLDAAVALALEPTTATTPGVEPRGRAGTDSDPRSECP